VIQKDDLHAEGANHYLENGRAVLTVDPEFWNWMQSDFQFFIPNPLRIRNQHGTSNPTSVWLCIRTVARKFSIEGLCISAGGFGFLRGGLIL